MPKLKSNIVALIFIFVTFYQTNAQCSMCRAVLETEEGQNAAKGINDGIVYLMLIPYILVAGLGYIIYLKFFKVKKAKIN